MKILLTVLTAVVLAFPAFAYRVEFLVTHDGKPVEDSEICFFSSTSVLNPFGHFLASDDVRCLPSDQVIDMPAGQWNFFGRAGNRFTTAGPALLQTRNDQRELGYQALTVPIAAAAVLDFSAVRKTLADDESLVVFVPTPFGAASNARPVPRGENEVLVPANTSLVPLVVRDGRPVRIGDAIKLEPGQRRSAVFTKAAAGTGDVVIWLKFDAEMAHDLDQKEPVIAPKIAVVSNKGEQKPLLAIENAALSDLLFVFFRGVPAGSARVTMQGELWEPSEVAMSIADGAVTVIEEPLSMALAGTVTLRWRIEGDPKRAAMKETCDGQAAAAVRKMEADGKRMLRIVRCVDEAAGECRVFFEQELAAGVTEGTANVASLATGQYVAELRVPPFAPVREEIYVLPRRATDLDLVAAPVTIYGSVTREGKPVRAALSVAGESFVTAESGAFSAAVLRAKGISSIEVRPCDTRLPFLYRPATALDANSFLTIDIPRRALEVRVVDHDSEEPLDDAKVTLVIPHAERSDDAAAVLALRYEETRSLYILSPYSPQQSRVCASAVGHEQACVDVAVHSSEPLVVALERTKGGTRGRVITEQPIVDGLLYVVAPSGEVLDRSMIASDGAFELPSLPPPDVYYVLTARNQPLGALAVQPGADTLTLTRPRTPLRHFIVRLEQAGAIEQGRIAFSVGGTRIPIEAFERHQQLRGWAPLFVTAQPYFVGDVAAAGAISAQLIPIGSGEGTPPFNGVLPVDNDMLILH